MSAQAWTTIRDAVHAWVVAGSGYAGDHVIWQDQGLAEPSKPYISLAWIGLSGVGQDEVVTKDATDPAPGAELAHHVRGSRVVVLSMQVYLTSADTVGETQGMAVLSDVRSERFAPGTEESLRDAGVGVAAMGGARAVGTNVDTIAIEPRVVMEVTCNVGAEIVRTGTYIQRAEITNETAGEVFEAPETTGAAGSAAGSSGASGVSA